MAVPTKPYSPANEAHVKSRKRQAERDALIVRDAFAWVMSDRRGRLVIGQIIVGAGFFANPFSVNGSQTDFNCGRQAQGQKLVDFLEDEFPREFLVLESERLAAKIEAKQQDEAARTETTQAQTDPGIKFGII